MCGICGIYNFRAGETVEPGLLNIMCERMRHRGPDDEGHYLSGNFGMAMRRLSIIDLFSGHQPIHNEDRTIWAVINGEIYNYQELRKDLVERGHHFYTRTDGEVIVHLFEEEGIDFINKLNGMFSIALWDDTRRQLYLIRDRLGIKPLFYYLSDGSISFASEIKALTLLPEFSREVNPVSLARYLAFDYVPAPGSIYRQTHKVSPGHYLRINDQGVQDKSYWDLSYEPKIFKSEEDYLDELDELLRQAVKRRLISDVPLGAFLSGGIDSSLIVAIMAELSNAPVKAFTIAFDDPSFDESRWAKIAADHIGVEHLQDRLTLDRMLELLPEIGRYIDEPFGDGSFVPTYLLCQFTRKNVTVSLSGDGGDELFVGYPTYQAYRIANIYKNIPRVIHQGLIKPLISHLPTSFNNLSLDFKARKFIDGIEYNPFERNYTWLGTFSPPEVLQVLHPDLAAEIAADSIYEPIRDYLKHTDAKDDLEKILYLDMKLYLQDDMLVKIDRASMANSLEARVPYLDHELVEFFCRIPLGEKFRGLHLKHLFKKLAARYLPPEIINRPKKGFGMPIAKWLLADSTGFIKERILACPYYNPIYIEKLLSEHSSKARDHRKKIWNLYCGTFC